MSGVHRSDEAPPSTAGGVTPADPHAGLYRGVARGGGGVVLVDKAGTALHGGTPLSLEEYLDLPEDTRAEIVDGVVRPMTREQRLNRDVTRRLASELDRQSPAGFRVLVDEVIVLGVLPAWARIPDVAVLRPDPSDDGRDNNTPAADTALVVEVLSPSTRSAETREKPVEYALGGIPAYWTVDLRDGITVTVYRLTPTAHVPAAEFRRGDTVRDPAAPWAAVEVTPLLGYYA